MEFRNITTFLKVAELKNFSKAAEKLGYSQSAVTIQIQQLEKELGTKLFERIGKGVELTEKGQSFIFYANELLRIAEKAVEDTEVPAVLDTANLTGTLRIGSVESISTALLPKILLEFHKICPKINVIVHTTGRDRLIEEIRNNQIDMFFTMEEKRMVDGLKRTILRKEKIVFIAPPALCDAQDNGSDHASDNSANSKMKINDLINLPFLLTEKGESYRHELEKYLWKHEAQMKPILEISNTETLLHLVECQMGYSFLPFFSVADSIRSGKIALLETEIPTFYMWSQLFYHKNKWLSPQMKAFITLTENYFQSSNEI